MQQSLIWNKWGPIIVKKNLYYKIIIILSIQLSTPLLTSNASLVVNIVIVSSAF